MDVAFIPPWSPYAARTSLPSAGRITLTSAFGQVIDARHGIPSHELPETFAAPDDDGWNDACRDQIRLEAETMTEAFISGRMTTYARPLGGGDILLLPAAKWELDDPLPRFATGVLNLERWSDHKASPSHRVFVNSDQFDDWLAGLPDHGPLSDWQIENSVDPRLRAARSVAARTGPHSTFAAERQLEPKVSPVEPAGVGPVMLTIREVSAIVGLKQSTIYAKIRSAGFPKQSKLFSASRWEKQEVEDWLRTQAAKRGT